MDANTLEDLVGTRWSGDNRLWLDPDAPPQATDATVAVEPGVLRYTWAYEGEPHTGSYAFRRAPGSTAVEATFTDSWHQKLPMVCEGTAGTGEGALLAVGGVYPAPEGPPWGWRTVVSLRPTGELVLQMINVTPWGEEALAVQLVARREG